MLDQRWYVALTLHQLAMAYGYLFDSEQVDQAANESLALSGSWATVGGLPSHWNGSASQ